MTRAKERLKQLEARNQILESEVVKLKQRIAILDHVVAANGGVRGSAGLVDGECIDGSEDDGGVIA